MNNLIKAGCGVGKLWFLLSKVDIQHRVKITPSGLVCTLCYIPTILHFAVAKGELDGHPWEENELEIGKNGCGIPFRGHSISSNCVPIGCFTL